MLPDLAGEWQPLLPSHCPTPRALEPPTALCDVPADAPGPSPNERSTLRSGKGRGIVSEPHPPGTVRSYDTNKARRRVWVLKRHSMAHMTASLIRSAEALLVP